VERPLSKSFVREDNFTDPDNDDGRKWKTRHCMNVSYTSKIGSSITHSIITQQWFQQTDRMWTILLLDTFSTVSTFVWLTQQGRSGKGWGVLSQSPTRLQHCNNPNGQGETVNDWRDDFRGVVLEVLLSIHYTSLSQSRLQSESVTREHQWRDRNTTKVYYRPWYVDLIIRIDLIIRTRLVFLRINKGFR
jgi:hypothetical protein